MQISSNTIQVFSGKYLDLKQPHPDAITMPDIAIGLSRECRFGGQTIDFYSVAQHCVFVSLLVPKEYQMAALLHDASEAYLRDISTPLKRMIPTYKEIEARLQATIFKAFGVDYAYEEKVAAAIKVADLQMLVTERSQLMPPDGVVWPGVDDQIEPLGFRIKPLEPKEALRQFQLRFKSIQNDTPFNIDGIMDSVSNKSECRYSHL